MGEISRGEPLAVICGSSSRSPIAVSLLERAGITDLVNVDEGMAGWYRAGLPAIQDTQSSIQSKKEAPVA